MPSPPLASSSNGTSSHSLLNQRLLPLLELGPGVAQRLQLGVEGRQRRQHRSYGGHLAAGGKA